MIFVSQINLLNLKKLRPVFNTDSQIPVVSSCALKKKFIKTWVKNTFYFKRRRKSNLKKTLHPRYYYKKIISSLKLYKCSYLKYKSFFILKFNFFLKYFHIFTYLHIYLHKKKSIFSPKSKVRLRKKIGNITRLFKTIPFKKLVLKNKKYRSKLKGNISFVNVWISFFHKFNLKKLGSTISKKNSFIF